MIEKFKSTHEIDLLSSNEGTDSVMAHLTFKKFPQNIKNVMLTLSSTHYPTFSELKTFVPKTVERLIKTGSNSTDSLSCNVGLNNKGAKPTYDNSNKYCLFCKEDNHFSSDCLKFSTYLSTYYLDFSTHMVKFKLQKY